MKTITVKALGLTGPEWIERLEKNKYRLSSYAKDVLNSPDWERERMKKGEEVEVAFVSVKEMGKSSATTKEIQEYAADKGYGIPKGELALLVGEAVSDKEIDKMGAWYIATLHSPIADSGGDPLVLHSDRDGDGPWVGTYWDGPGGQWRGLGAFAFSVLAKSALGTEEISSERLETESLEARVRALEEWRERVQQP